MWTIKRGCSAPIGAKEYKKVKAGLPLLNAIVHLANDDDLTPLRDGPSPTKPRDHHLWPAGSVQPGEQPHPAEGARLAQPVAKLSWVEGALVQIPQRQSEKEAFLNRPLVWAN